MSRGNGEDGNARARHPNTFRMLLATDNHLGYAEKDPVRGDDSFRAFQEILQLGRDEQVDLLLLGGDLFHENKPSRSTMYQTMRLLRSYCMGDGAVQFQIVSDQSINFPNFGTVNYEDPNYNIELPVFSIHGNHDDPAREAGGARAEQQSLAALDLLSAANLVNYFGKSDKADAIEVFPILMVKGETKVAIYGLGSMRDERLNRMFAQQKVVFRRPAENPETWFSIFVVHQNRDDRGRGAKNCLPESFIPDFIDFVIWGHEHECCVDVQESLKGDFFITQPGSSVATSLVEGEAVTKQVAILEVQGQSFRMSSRVLTSVRPFKLGEIVLNEVDELEPNDANVTDKIRIILEERVLELLTQIDKEVPNRPPELQQPLVRVRVEHSGFPVLVNQRFGSRFVGKVANPNDILLFYRRKEKKQTGSKSDVKQGSNLMGLTKDGGSLRDPIRPTRLDAVTIEDLLAKQLHRPEQTLVFLPEKPLAIALEDYIVKNIPSALEEFVDSVLKDTQRELENKKETHSKQDILAAMEKKKDRSNAEQSLQEEQEQEEEEEEENRQGKKSTRRDGFQESIRSQTQTQTTQKTQGRHRGDSFDDDEEEEEEMAKPSARSTSRAKATSATGRFGTPRNTTTAAAKRKQPAAASKKKSTARHDEDEDGDDDYGDDGDDYVEVTAVKKRKTPERKAAPVRAARAKKTTTKQRELFSDEEEDGGGSGDNDGDEDFEMGDDDEGDEESEMAPRKQQQQPPRPVSSRRGKATTAAAAAVVKASPGRKRLRKANNSDDSDDDEYGTLAKAKKAPAMDDEIDLVSSEGETTPSTARKPPLGRAKPTPQPKISEMFKKTPLNSKKQKKKDDDDIDSDPEFFTQLTSATAATAAGGGLGRNESGDHASQSQSQAQPSQSQSQFLSQLQSQGSQSSGGKKRKLPLSMLAASQVTPNKQGTSDGATASAARKGWGRTRR